jgi:hypothetical protein
MSGSILHHATACGASYQTLFNKAKITVPFLVATFFLCFFLLPAFAHASAITAPANNLGLVGYWSFNEGTSTIAHDFSGHGNNGTLSGSTLPTWTSGKLGNALNFTGSNYVQMASPLGISNNSFTFSEWIKTTSTNGQMYTIGNAGGGNGYRFGLGAGMVAFLIGNASGYTENTCGTATANDGRWHLVSGVFDRTNLVFRCYIDGLQVGTVAIGGSFSGMNDTPGAIGKPVCCTAFVGSLDDVRIYSRALGATEIAALYQAGAAKINASQSPGTLSSSLVGWWTMDGADTVWSSATAGTEADKSGNNNTGTLNGFTRATAAVVGKIGQALNFASASTYITFPNISLASTPYTVSAWIYKKDTGDFNVVGGGAGGGNANAHYIVRSSVVYFGNYGCDLGGTTTINPGKWYFVTYVMGSNQYQSIYVNGALDAGPAYTCGYYTSYVNEIGNSCCGGPGLGKIDDVRIYSRAFSASEVKNLYNAGTGTHVNTSSTNLQSNSSLSSGLVGLWTFDGSKTNWATGITQDSSGQGNNGQLINMSTTTSPTIGKLGQALKFNGSSSYVRVPNSSSLNPVNLTVSTWAKSVPSTWNDYGFLVSKRNVYIIHPNQGATSVNFYIYTTTWQTVSCTPSGSITNWNLYTMTWDGTNLTAYINGVQCSTAQPGGSLTTSDTNELNIGRDAGLSRYFNGSEDDVRIYNRALSAAEVKQLYNLGK